MKFTLNNVDLSQYVKGFAVDATYDDSPEPLRHQDCPYPVATPEHSGWVREHVIDRQRDFYTNAHKAAKAAADERLAKLRNAWGVRREQPTYAYGKTVDELVAFIDSDAPPTILDYVDGGTVATGTVLTAPINVDTDYSFLRQYITDALNRNYMNGPHGITRGMS